MEREKLYRTLFKFNENNEQTFCEFKQLTPVGKRIVYIVLNLALGETKVKSTNQWHIKSIHDEKIPFKCDSKILKKVIWTSIFAKLVLKSMISLKVLEFMKKLRVSKQTAKYH